MNNTTIQGPIVMVVDSAELKAFVNGILGYEIMAACRTTEESTKTLTPNSPFAVVPGSNPPQLSPRIPHVGDMGHPLGPAAYFLVCSLAFDLQAGTRCKRSCGIQANVILPNDQGR